MGPTSDPSLARFSPATRAWFESSFDAPTAAQAGAWAAIGAGQHALVVAPTGSGKTLAAFLSAVDRLACGDPPPEPQGRCRVLYISPMKALATDVERNLRSPLVGIGHAAARIGAPVPQISVSVRSGDTPADERRRFARNPTDILITTPESLFLLLTSAAREALRSVEVVIVDEVHALAGTKRGAHLALSLERLDAILEHPAQRIGLSATVRPVAEVARFLAGGRPVEIVAPPSAKAWDLQVVVPVPDMTELTPGPSELSGAASSTPRNPSIWPHVESRIVDLISAHRSTIVFANSRRLAERLTARLNELWQERLDAQAAVMAEPTPRRPPAEAMGAAGSSRGAAPVLARAHHGSVSKEQRRLIEDDLKAGRLPAVVATSSLELGIDMGAVDLVVQVESPPSVASGLQRVGRAGHQVGAVSRGVLFPKFRGDLLETAVVVERMRSGAIEELRVPANPLDVLAQQLVAMTAMDTWAVGNVLELVRRSAPFAGLTEALLEATLDMLSGIYPSEEFAELRPRIVYDRAAGTVTGRPGAARLAVTSGGTIPDRGLYGVFLAGSDGPGRRVGELDEEMVYESRIGDTFTLGTSTWRIEDITHDQVLVTPAPGEPGRLPFWKGDQPGRPAELGRAVGAFLRELDTARPADARARLEGCGLDAWAQDNLLAHVAEQRQATGELPDDQTLVVERFRDELGDWRVVIHSPLGAPVHGPWALIIAARMRERFGVDVQAMPADDGIVIRLPDVEFEEADDLAALLAELVVVDPAEVAAEVTREIGGSALFAARFRECAARALLLPRRRPDRRQPLWQQRQRSAQLLQVASRYPSFPIVLETVRECVQDVYDVPGLTSLMHRLAEGSVRLVTVETGTPSPFARSLLFGYVAQFLYEGDSPLAEKRAAALAMDPALLAELLGTGDGLSLRDLLDADQVARTEADLQWLSPQRQARDLEALADLLRVLGPLTDQEITARTAPSAAGAVGEWLNALVEARRVIPVRRAGHAAYAVVEDAGRLRDALGVSLPVGLPEAYTAPQDDPVGDLVARYARTHGPFTAAEIASWLGVGVAVVRDALSRLAGAGRVTRGEFRPVEHAAGPEFCDPGVLRLLRRRSLAALRAEVEPVSASDYARFLLEWHHVRAPLRGVSGVLAAIEQLGGMPLPASAIETLILPARVRDYSPSLLDDLIGAGDVAWRGHAGIPGNDGWISLHLADRVDDSPRPAAPQPLSETAAAVSAALGEGGAWLFSDLRTKVAPHDDRELADGLWEAVWAGQISADSFAPVRAMIAGKGTHRSPSHRPRPTTYSRSPSRGLLTAGGRRPVMPSRAGPPQVVGRWYALPSGEADPVVHLLSTAESLLDRYAVVTRAAAAADEVPGGFASIYRVLSAAEDAGRIRRGYFVEGLGASQFAPTSTIDRLRAFASSAEPRSTEQVAVVLAATDPASPYGAALAWPQRPDPTSHQPGRKAGALVVLLDGILLGYLERGGRSLLTFTKDADQLAIAARALARTVTEGSLGSLSVHRIDGISALQGPPAAGEALRAAGFVLTPRGLRLRR